MWSLDLDFIQPEQSSKFREDKKPEWKLISQESGKNYPGPLTRHSAVVYNNSAFIYGGLKPDGTASQEMFKFDLKSLRWDLIKQKENGPGQREGHSCCLL